MASRDYWIVFKQSEHWTQRFLKKGFGHCFVLFKEDSNFQDYNWCVVDPKINCLKVQVLGYPAADDVPMLLFNDGYRVIHVVVDETKDMHFKAPKLVTCVSMIKYILGIKVFAITPYRLYKKLSNKYYFKNIKRSRVLP